MPPAQCPYSASVAAQLAEPGARLDTELLSHMPGCEACRRAAARAVRGWPADRTPSPSLAEWLRAADTKATVLSPYQAAKVAAGETGALELGPYLLLDRLGAGGMGEVFRARHKLLQRIDALKTLRPELAENDSATRRFVREAEAVAKLRHPNVVHVYNADRAGAGYYLAMEFVPGADLGKFARAHRPLPVALAAEFVRQAAEGVQHAFAHGLVHRDLKPGNLLLHLEGPALTRGTALQLGEFTVKVADFGLARAFAPGAAGPMTGAGTVLGTTDYMAPEQAADARAADTRADVYSLGCTLYFLLTGEVPFPGGNAFEKMARHALAPVPSCVALRADVPAALDAVVQKCLGKRPEERFQTPGELAAALRPFARTSQPVPVAPLDLPEPETAGAETDTWVSTVSHSRQRAPRATKPPQRNSRWVWACAAILLLAVVIAVVVQWPRGPKPETAAQTEPTKRETTGDAKKVPETPPQPDNKKTNPNLPKTGTEAVPKANAVAPWVFAGGYSGRTDKVRAVGFAPDGSVVAGREGLNGKGTDTGFWERWELGARDRPQLSKRPAGTGASEYPVYAGAAGLVTDRLNRFDPITFEPLPALAADISSLGGKEATMIDRLCASGNGRCLVGSTRSAGKRYVVQWSTETGAVKTGWEVPTAEDILAVSADGAGNTVATGTNEGRVFLNTTTDRKHAWTAPPTAQGTSDPVGAVAVTAAGSKVFSAHASGTVYAWTAEQAKPVTALALGWDGAVRLALSPDGRWLACAGGAVVVYDLKTDPPTAHELAEHWAGDLKSVAFGADGKRLLVGGWALRSGSDKDGDAVVWLWELKP